MTTEAATTIPEPTIEALREGLERGLAQILGGDVAFKQLPEARRTDPGHCGSIEFSGDASFVVGLAVADSVGPDLARRFTGVPIAVDSDAMPDVVAEIVNVIAGDVVARLDQVGQQVAMSLPHVRPTTDVAELGRTVRTWSVGTDVGEFQVILIAAERIG